MLARFDARHYIDVDQIISCHIEETTEYDKETKDWKGNGNYQVYFNLKDGSISCGKYRSADSARVAMRRFLEREYLIENGKKEARYSISAGDVEVNAGTFSPSHFFDIPVNVSISPR